MSWDTTSTWEPFNPTVPDRNAPKRRRKWVDLPIERPTRTHALVKRLNPKHLEHDTFEGGAGFFDVREVYDDEPYLKPRRR